MSKPDEKPKPIPEERSEDGKRLNSPGWVKNAFAITSMSEIAATVICDDDCPNCRLYKKGCAGRCIRWDDMVCSTCPCLGSKWSDKHGLPNTVNPKTGIDEFPNPVLLKISKLRKSLSEGEPIDMESVTLLLSEENDGSN